MKTKKVMDTTPSVNTIVEPTVVPTVEPTVEIIPEKFDYTTIDSIEKAFNHLDKDYHQFLIDNRGEQKAKLASKELTIIFDAINGDWVADWKNPNQVKYLPIFKRVMGHAIYDKTVFMYTPININERGTLSTDTFEKSEFIGKVFSRYYTMIL